LLVTPYFFYNFCYQYTAVFLLLCTKAVSRLRLLELSLITLVLIQDDLTASVQQGENVTDAAV